MCGCIGEMLDDHNDVDKSKPWQGALNVPLVCAGPGIRRNATVDVPMATVDIGATMVDFAGAVGWRDGKMTAQSFRGLLEGADPATRNRTVVQSGLQSFNFGARTAAEIGEIAVEEADEDDEASEGKFNFRLAVAEMDGPPRSTFKFVCCQGKCPGAPSTVGQPGADGYTRLLYDTVADPFDMTDLKHALPHVAEALRRELPVMHGFNCSRA